jgi:hypothetical protein
MQYLLKSAGVDLNMAGNSFEEEKYRIGLPGGQALQNQLHDLILM